MATAEAASTSLGPRYAPDDPTLPKPWKGLIDGSTGVLYYWNPETNITQYEKPAAFPPPLLTGQSPANSTPKLAPISVANTMQPNAMVNKQNQHQMTQATSQGVQQMCQLPQHHGPMAVQVAEQPESQQQSSQLVQGMQHPGQFAPQMKPQMMQYTDKQMPQQPGHPWLQQPRQHMQQQSIQQMSQHPGQQLVSHHTPELSQPRGHQYSQQQLQYTAYQGISSQGQHSSHQQTQHGSQGQQFSSQQDYSKASITNREEVDFPPGNQPGFFPSNFQQTGASSSQKPPDGTKSMKTGVHSSHIQQFGGSSNLQQPNPMVQLQQTGTDMANHQHGPRLENQIGPQIMHNNPSNLPPFGLNRVYEENIHGSTDNDYYFNGNKDGPVMGAQQPKLAALPVGRNQQETRIGGALPGQAAGQNAVAGHTVHGMYSHAGPFPNNAMMRPPFVGSPGVTNLSPAEVYRQQHEVSATGDNVPTPFMTFESSGLPPEILREMHSAGFSSPTPIQAQTWPIALQGRDIVAIAKTGSGKTLGYLIPAFILLRQRRNNPRNGPTVLILAPTRELATQIQDEASKFGRSLRISSTCLYGGAPKGPQLRELDQGAEIVVATPGRLNDILEMKKIEFGQVSLLVLDEADRMLDMGFEPQIRKIVNEMPPRRQTLMYTATWPKDVIKIASDLLVSPIQVNIGNVDELAANKAITQHVEIVPPMEKERRLQQILRSQERGSRVIIFCSTKRLCDQLARNIGRNFGAIAIHGDKSQGERDWVLNQFRSGKSPILVATDVAARGLDIKDIRVVINYDFPTGVEDYVHRIGRTGRAGATGVAYTFFCEQDSKHAADLIKVLEGANQHVPPEVREMALRKDRGGVSRFVAGSGHWDSGGRGGMREGGFGGRGGRRDGGFGGRGGMRDGGFGGRAGMRDGGFGGCAGVRDCGFGGYEGRNEMVSGRGNRRQGFGGHGGSNVGSGRNERSPRDQYNSMDGRGRGRGQGRFDSRRDVADRGSRGRSRSRSPVRTWGYSSRSRSRSRSRSSSSRSRSRSRSRSWSRSRSRSWSRGHSRSPSPNNHSRSHSRDRYERQHDRRERRVSGFDVLPESQTSSMIPAAPMSPGLQGGVLPASEPTTLLKVVDSSEPEPVLALTGADPGYQSVSDL